MLQPFHRRPCAIGTANDNDVEPHAQPSQVFPGLKQLRRRANDLVLLPSIHAASGTAELVRRACSHLCNHEDLTILRNQIELPASASIVAQEHRQALLGKKVRSDFFGAPAENCTIHVL